MSEIKALEKLREIAADINASEIVDHMKLYPSCVFDGAWLDAWHDEYYRAIDKLESEIAERFIELPADADGEAIHVGDDLECLGKNVLLNSLVWDGQTWYATETVASSGWYPVSICSHVKQRTLEDVLKEVMAETRMAVNPNYWIVDKYADEIRELLGVSE